MGEQFFKQVAAGGGRYERETQGLLVTTGAEAVVLLVAHQEIKKSGFSVAMTTSGYQQMLKLAAVLRSAADQIEQSTKLPGGPPVKVSPMPEGGE